MANQLKMATIHSILTLRERKWSYRRIARELGIHRETVARYVKLAQEGSVPSTGIPASGAKPANPLAGCNDSKPANPPTGYAGPLSLCEPFREAINEALERGLSGQRIWQDLRTDHDFAGSYDSVKRFCRRLKRTRPLPFRRMECQPGEEARIDFGSGAPVIRPDAKASTPGAKGRRKRTHVFRIVLSHSRKGYSEAVFRQTTEEFIRCLENAFQHFGGVPQTLVIDNLKAAVTKADRFDPDLNPKIQAFCKHYGTVILPTKPRTPRHKGKIERGVDYVQENGLKGHRFASLEDQNRHLLDWETSVADTRIHGTTRKQVGKVFTEVERPALLPLPVTRFPSFHEAKRTVHRDGHVEVDRAYYSVPPEHVAREVWARWDSRIVRIFNAQMEQIAVHVKHQPGRFSTQSPHIAGEKISGVERGAAWLLDKAGLIGFETQRWAEAMINQRGIQGVRILQGLLSLTHKHPCDLIDKACQIAQTHGEYRLRTIRQLIKREEPKQEQFEFIQEHPIIRSLADYEDLVHESFTAEPLHPGEHPRAAPGDTSSAGFPRPLPWASFPSLMTGEHHE